VNLGVEVKGEDVVILVMDNGIGIAPKNHELIFESFRQVDGTSTRRYGGSGLGLSIAKKFVEVHGGEIWVESIEGAGSTFGFRLPRRAPTQEFSEGDE